MGPKEGPVIHVNHDAFTKYVRAAGEYAKATIISAEKMKPELKWPLSWLGHMAS
jgi:hypothetical protein